jgi:hypothetical protein
MIPGSSVLLVGSEAIRERGTPTRRWCLLLAPAGWLSTLNQGHGDTAFRVWAGKDRDDIACVSQSAPRPISCTGLNPPPAFGTHAYGAAREELASELPLDGARDARSRKVDHTR